MKQPNVRSIKTRAIVAGGVVLVVLLFIAILLVVSRKPPQAITVRHFKSVQSASNITTMTFEITNHTATLYSFSPNGVQVRNGNVWNKFQGDNFHYAIALAPTGLAYCTVNVTNLPAKSVVRFSIQPYAILFGLSTVFRRAELRFGEHLTYVSLNPYDKIWGKATDVTSDEFVEQYGVPK